MSDFIIDNDIVEKYPEIVLDGQNIAYNHGKQKAKELGCKGFFSYEGLKIAAESLYKNGYRASFILPYFWCKKSKIRHYDDAQNIVDYLKKNELIICVGGEKSNKIDDAHALRYAHDNDFCLITNDQFRTQLEELNDNVQVHWKNWIDANSIGFTFQRDSFFLNRNALSIDYIDVPLIVGDARNIQKNEEVSEQNEVPNTMEEITQRLFTVIWGAE
jgi:hypothetical protein